MRTDFETVLTGRPLFNQLQLAHESGGHVMLHGPPGTGKSEHFAAYCESAGIGHRVVNLAMCDATDLAGLPFQQDGRTWYATPGFWPTADNEPEGIVVAEEINRADPTTVAPLFDLITSGKLGNYRLPPGWTFGACVNDDGQVYPLDPALFDRFAHFCVVPSKAAWLEYAARHEIHPAVINYVRGLPDAEFGLDPSPRAWAYASRVLTRTSSATALSAAEVRTALAGWLGRDAAARLVLSMRQGTQGLAAEDVLGAYPAFRATVQDWVKTGRVDLVSATLDAVDRGARGLGPQPRTSPAIRNLTTLVSDLQGDAREQGAALLKRILLAESR